MDPYVINLAACAASGLPCSYESAIGGFSKPGLSNGETCLQKRWTRNLQLAYRVSLICVSGRWKVMCYS